MESVVPTFAPSISGTDCGRVINPALMNPHNHHGCRTALHQETQYGAEGYARHPVFCGPMQDRAQFAAGRVTKPFGHQVHAEDEQG